MTHFKRTSRRGQGLAAVLAAVLLLAAGCGAPSGAPAGDGGAAPDASPAASAGPNGADGVAEASPPPSEAAAEEPAAGPTATPPRPLGVISAEEARLNCFLTGIVQQNIVNTRTDLDEDAELVRFVFGYRKTNDPASIREREDGGAVCPTLTVEQVNETLTGLFGKSVSPDREDYSILSDGSEGFHCFFRDGVFWNVPPYPAERYPFPLRFALVTRIDPETASLHFKLYRANPWIWGEEETERHLGVLPFMNVREAESSDVVSFLGEGDAVLRDFGEELQLVEMTGSVTR